MALHAARAIRQRHKAASEAAAAAEQLLLSEDGTVELSPEQRKALVEAFEAADKNGDGVISADEYFQIFQSHGLSIDREWVDRTIARNDKDGDGGINFEEFVDMNIRSRLSRQAASSSSSSTTSAAAATLNERAKLAFNAYDRNHDGFLTKAEMRKTSKNMTEAQIEAVFEKYDKNKDGKLDFDEFKNLMESNKKQ